jgi:hypothetical protein
MAQGGSGGIRQFIGLTGEEEVRRAFKSLGEVGEKAFRDISRAAQASAGNVGKFGASTRTAEAGVRSLSRTVSDALTGLSAFKAGLGALAGAAVVRGGFNIFDDTLQKMRDLRNASLGSGAPKEVIAAFQQALTEAGGKAENLAPAFVQAAGAIADARKEMKQLGNSAFPNIAIMKGNEGAANQAAAGIRVLKGAAEDAAASGNNLAKAFHGTEGAAIDVSTPFKALEIDITKFGQTTSEQVRLWQTIVDQFQKISKTDPSRAIRAGALILGEDDVSKVAAAMKKLADEGIPAFIEKAKAAGKLPDEEAFKRLDEYDAKVAALTGQWDKLVQQVVFTTFPFITLELKGATNLVKGVGIEVGRIKDGFLALGPAASQAFADLGAKLADFGEASGITGFFTTLWETFTTQGGESFLALQPAIDAFSAYLSTALADPWTALADIVTGVWDRMKAAAESVLGWIGDKLTAIANIASSIGSAIGSVLGSIPIAPGMASGGMVRGPGTGTSDSVLARLSAGEYVVRARAVDHWGPQFLHALNSLRNPLGFAGGGLVGLGASLLPASNPHFAEGGLAAAESGTPVHLHFPSGGQVQLRGDRAVTEALLREARRSQMLSAGRRPGTFAAA